MHTGTIQPTIHHNNTGATHPTTIQPTISTHLLNPPTQPTYSLLIIPGTAQPTTIHRVIQPTTIHRVIQPTTIPLGVIQPTITLV